MHNSSSSIASNIAFTKSYTKLVIALYMHKYKCTIDEIGGLDILFINLNTFSYGKYHQYNNQHKKGNVHIYSSTGKASKP